MVFSYIVHVPYALALKEINKKVCSINQSIKEKCKLYIEFFNKKKNIFFSFCSYNLKT
jgi:hypothetical protein